jgi:hypothetical protein
MGKVLPYQSQLDEKKSDIVHMNIAEREGSNVRYISKEKEQPSVLTESFTSENRLNELVEMRAHFISIAYGESHHPHNSSKATSIHAKAFLGHMKLKDMKQSLSGIIKSILF